MSITATMLTDAHGNLTIPKDPYKFAKDIECTQDSHGQHEKHMILFNKGRYFETTIRNKELLENVSRLSGIAISYNNMIVGSWTEMEDFVIAMNIYGYYVIIDVIIDVGWV